MAPAYGSGSVCTDAKIGRPKLFFYFRQSFVHLFKCVGFRLSDCSTNLALYGLTYFRFEFPLVLRYLAYFFDCVLHVLALLFQVKAVVALYLVHARSQVRDEHILLAD